ncbi:hypothetical protein EMCG_04598 [[Emmonsia] crescens]|uniref:Uncharacterized protein n=1 Tax=[Emmonsia] crescens TaxID=73230 RepID=A0A0G2IYN8_9EURO|nr:hypothetical protein EMCG_04598 [Emmonsia crescens UAMH 3008]
MNVLWSGLLGTRIVNLARGGILANGEECFLQLKVLLLLRRGLRLYSCPQVCQSLTSYNGKTTILHTMRMEEMMYLTPLALLLHNVSPDTRFIPILRKKNPVQTGGGRFPLNSWTKSRTTAASFRRRQIACPPQSLIVDRLLFSGRIPPSKAILRGPTLPSVSHGKALKAMGTRSEYLPLSTSHINAQNQWMSRSRSRSSSSRHQRKRDLPTRSSTDYL